MSDTCRACGAKRLSPLINFGHLPKSSQSLYPSFTPSELVPFELESCLDCGHLQNSCAKSISDDHYGEDYLYSVTHSNAAKELQSKVADNILALTKIGPEDKVIEVGCGDGYLLDSLSSTGANCLGYEPSASFQLAQARKSIRVFNSYYDPNQNQADCSLLIYRHVLEHLLEPESFFKNASAKYLYIEVPRAEYLVRTKMYSDFYNDHISYFSEFSLSRFLQRFQYKVLSTSLAGNGEFLGLLAEKSKEPFQVAAPAQDWFEELRDFASGWKSYKQDVDRRIEEALCPNCNLTVWGAGSRGITLLYHLALNDRITQIVDSDPNKLGRYIAGFKNPVKHPDSFLTDANGLLLITSATFAQEISAQVKQQGRISGELNILTLYPPSLERIQSQDLKSAQLGGI